ncbi:hypothetical protein J2Z18_003802 [Paenibacillus lactis]|uniref:Uncharacterized protein n=1 Tax=Paenibacillus lactis TaxID=228574 RepID=A0ABS4FEL5_9BACL|nr:hypothetical protein [Paenibacillus lactis]
MASWWTWHYDGLELRWTGITMDWYYGRPGITMDLAS